MSFKITYSVLNADLSQLHSEFDQVLTKVKSVAGQKIFPSYVAGKAVESGQLIEDFNPADTRQLLAKFHKAIHADCDRAFEASKKAQKAWAAMPFTERNKIIFKAADLISERRLEISAVMCLETGKNRLEALGDVEEAADLLRYYAKQVEDNNGYLKPLAKLSPNEDTRSVLKPYGVFAVISPFNFPLALAAGMSSAALVAGNSVVLKPSQETPWCADYLYKVLQEAGLPDGVFQLLHGTGPDLGAYMIHHPLADGLVFTGSKAIGMDILRTFSTQFPKPVLLELGGKNPCIVSDKADLAKAVDGCAKSAFGLSGQKCSALSRIFVHKKLKEEFVSRLVEKVKTFKIGDPTQKDVFMGPVISKSAVERFERCVVEAKRDGKILFGGEMLRQTEPYKHGWFAQPTICEVPYGHRLTREEHFAPFVTVNTFESFDEALRLANDAEYGLTAGVFSEDKSEVERFMNEIEAGVVYSNRASGATTGAWPGVQAFCGWKGSGAGGKGGCGPYYVSQFMREQSQTRVG
jgi:1-pyrroline-5-carboxylate dehydrogenase